jgi:hypothetical protein
MKKLLTFHLSLFTFFVSAALADNQTITNPIGQPIPTFPAPYGGNVKSTAKEASHVLKASAGNLVWLIVSSDSSQFILVMDSATVPGDGAVTLLCPPISVGANTTTMINFPIPLKATAGIAVCNSNANSFTKTLGSANCIFTAQVQ